MLTEQDKHWIDERLERVAARVERVETTLLTEFYKWASPTDKRIHSHSIAITALDEQASSALNDIKELRDRLQKVERSLLNPPQQ